MSGATAEAEGHFQLSPSVGDVLRISIFRNTPACPDESRENAESRSSLDSIEKNKMNSANVTMPMVRATASPCAWSAQLTTARVPTAISRPTKASQARSPRVRTGRLGGSGGRSISPAAGLLHPSPTASMDSMVKLTHSVCSGRSGSPPAMLKMLADRNVMM
jgi:hypothetical protein